MTKRVTKLMKDDENPIAPSKYKGQTVDADALARVLNLQVPAHAKVLLLAACLPEDGIAKKDAKIFATRGSGECVSGYRICKRHLKCLQQGDDGVIRPVDGHDLCKGLSPKAPVAPKKEKKVAKKEPAAD